MDLNYHPTEGEYLSTKIQSTNNYFYHKDAYLFPSVSVPENYKTNYKFSYTRDDNENITKITSTANTSFTTNYGYDELNRLKTEYNSHFNKNYTYGYLTNNKDINKITTVLDGANNYKNIEYDALGRMTKYYKSGVLQKEYTYESNYLNPQSITKNNITYNCTWKRDNLLTNYGTTEYLYNHQGQRTRKTTDTDNIMYYYDGSKLLGENRVKESGTLGTQNIRYIYDMLGITGVRYTKGSETIDYQYAKDGQPIVEYYYDAYGNCDEVILNQNDPYASINPIRWKSQYYDLETEMYYINSRYYDPEVYQYLDSLDIERIIESMDTIGGLNLLIIQ